MITVGLPPDGVHPEVFTRNGAAMRGSFLFTFCVSLAGMLCLAAAMIELELAGKQTALRLRELRRRLAGADL